MNPIRSLLVIPFLSFLSFSSTFSQTRTIEPANQHFFTIAAKDSAQQVYRKVTTQANENVVFERFFDLENRMIKNGL